MTGRYFGHVQHIIQQAEQVVAGLLHSVEILGLLGRERRFVQQRGHTQHLIQGRADFVAHAGQKGSLGPGIVFGIALGLLQGTLGTIPAVTS